MNQATAGLLLGEMMMHLPEDIWLLLRQKGVDEIGIAKALGRSHLEIDALLVNTGICRETPIAGIRIAKNWQTIFDGIDNIPYDTTAISYNHPYILGSTMVYLTRLLLEKYKQQSTP